MKYLLLRLRRIIKGILFIDVYMKVKYKKRYQKEIFNKHKKSFAIKYNEIKKYDNEKFITSEWRAYNELVEKEFIPYPEFGFLKNPVIMFTMFASKGGKIMKEELNFIESKFNEEELKNLLMEDYIGEPLILNRKYLTSHNSIHHLYSMTKFFDKTKVDLNTIDKIVEWGGGYGDMAKLFMRLKEKKLTYIIIDTSLFCMLQWLYLSSIFGEDMVYVISDKNDKIKENKINIIPIGLFEKININCDLFISTWALSECPKNVQDIIKIKNFFNAKHLLLAYQINDEWPDSKYIEKEISNYIYKEEIKFMKGNYYLFK